MTDTGALDGNLVPSIEEPVPPAWRRLWGGLGPRQDAQPSPQWTSGVTYRGYLGATGSMCASWTSEEQHRETQALLRSTAERFTRTLEMLGDGFILLDHEWCFLYLNPEAERILHRPKKALLGRCLLTEFPETASGSFLEKCMDASQTGKSVEWTKFYPPLGMWVHFKVWPSDQGFTFCIRDDTERIAARREILGLKAKLAAWEHATA